MTEPLPIKPRPNPDPSFRARKKVWLIAALILGVFFFWGRVSRAQEEFVDAKGVQVSPVRFDWDLNSGDERTGVINLKNYSDQPFEVSISAEDFFVSDDSSEARFFIPNQSHPLIALDVINWITLPENLVLRSGEGRDLTFKVKVPESTPTGGYYGAIFFKTKIRGQENETEEGSKIVVNQRVGALLVLAVKGSEPIRREARIDHFGPANNIFWENPARFEVRISNTGNLHFKGVGTVDIYRFGSKVATLDLEPRLSYPQRARDYGLEWKFPLWGYGYYRAELSYASEDRGVMLSSAADFWVFPWKTTAVLLAFLALLWLVYWLFTSKFEIRRKEGPKTEGPEEREAMKK